MGFPAAAAAKFMAPRTSDDPRLPNHMTVSIDIMQRSHPPKIFRLSRKADCLLHERQNDGP